MCSNKILFTYLFWYDELPWTNQAQLSWSLEKLARRLINSLVGIYLPHCLTDRVKIVISGFEVAY